MLAGYYWIYYDIIRYYWIYYDIIFLTSVTSGGKNQLRAVGKVWWPKNLEMIVRYCYYIWRYIDHLINIQPSDNSDKSRLPNKQRVYTTIAIQMICSFVTRKYACLRENDITCSCSIVLLCSHFHHDSIYAKILIAFYQFI